MAEFTFWIERVEDANTFDIIWGQYLVEDMGLLKDRFKSAIDFHILAGAERSTTKVELADIHVHDRMFDRGSPIAARSETKLKPQTLISNESGYQEIYHGSIEFEWRAHSGELPTFLGRW